MNCPICNEPLKPGELDCGCIDDYGPDETYERDRNSPFMNSDETWYQPRKGFDL